MTTSETVRAGIAEAESVISDEIAVLSPAWKNFVPKWKTYSLFKKSVAIIAPLTVILAGYWFGVDAAQFVSRPFRAEPVTKSELANVVKATVTLKNLTDDLQKASDGYKDQVEELKKHVDVLDYNFGQIAIELRALEQRLAEGPPAPPPKTVAKEAVKPSKITTGSLPPRKKSFDITDPSTWPTP